MSNTEPLSIYHDATSAPGNAGTGNADGRIRVSMGADGTMLLSDGQQTRTVLSPAIAEQIEDAERSAAQREIDLLKAKRQSIAEVVVEGKTRFIKSLTWSQTVEIGLQIGRENDGSLDIREHGVMRSFMLALLTECLAVAKDNDAPYFSRDEAEAYLDAEEVHVVGAHFDAITERNKGLLPKGVDANPTLGQESLQ